MRTRSRTRIQQATTFLTHFFDGGLADERYLVERFRSMADGEIKPVDGKSSRGGGKSPATLSRRSVTRLRPERNEIIIARGVSIDGGVGYWGDLATGLFVHGRYR